MRVTNKSYSRIPLVNALLIAAIVLAEILWHLWPCRSPMLNCWTVISAGDGGRLLVMPKTKNRLGRGTTFRQALYAGAESWLMMTHKGLTPAVSFTLLLFNQSPLFPLERG